MINRDCINSPIGPLTIGEEDGKIIEISFGNLETCDTIKETTVLRQAKEQLEEYFAGTRTVFQLPLSLKGTPFQEKVWAALCEIPYGSTASYLDIAVAVGNPKAVRAVGMANHRNPVSIVVPCHRVIGKSGSLVGYGGGLDAKKWLLHREGIAFKD